jgi:hypothetical protein
MSQDLVTISSNTALAHPPMGLGEGFDEDLFVLKPQIIELVQNSTKDKEPQQIGKFRTKASGSTFDEIKLVLLKVRKGRVLFPPGGELGADPLCRSNDGKVPSEDAASPQAMFCKTCPKGDKMWDTWKKTGKKPECQEKITLMFVERNSKVPYYLNVGGSSVKPVKAALSDIAGKVKVLQSEGKTPNLYDFSMTLKPLKVDGRKGTFYVCNVTNIAQVKEEDRAEFGELYKQYVSRVNAEQELVEAAQSVDAEVAAAGPVEA